MLQALFAILLSMGYLERLEPLAGHRMAWPLLRSKLESRPLQLAPLGQRQGAKLVRPPTLMLGERLKIPRGAKRLRPKEVQGTVTPVWREVSQLQRGTKLQRLKLFVERQKQGLGPLRQILVARARH
jgi:hypothetical protein